MQVKKFEAPTMKEALEMVKNHLGPSAIILNAKDNSRGFGLMGKNSIEITAAISEVELKKKQWAESRLKEEQLALLRQKSMKVQKEFIEKSVRRYTTNQEEEKKRRPLTQMKYIDIDDERESGLSSQMSYEEVKMKSQARTVDEILREIGQPQEFVESPHGDQRVKSAALSAFKAFENADITNSKTISKPSILSRSSATSMTEVQALKNEILDLKNIIQSFQTQSFQTQTFQPSKQSQAMHPGGELGVSFELSGIYNKLSQAGISDTHILRLIDLAKAELKEMIGKQSLAEGWIAKHMMNEIKVCHPDNIAPLHIFLGTTGSGKSASLVKLASHYVIQRNKKVGILTADIEKVGAVEQLRTYSQILNIPFGILNKPEDWNAVLSSLKNLDCVLIDFPGNALREMEAIERFRKMLPPQQARCDRHLVISSTFKDKDAFEITERYKIAKPTDVIFTKLDEAITHGLIYNFQKKFDLPLFSFGTGSNLPEDFEFATRERVIDLIFHITKVK